MDTMGREVVLHQEGVPLSFIKIVDIGGPTGQPPGEFLANVSLLVKAPEMKKEIAALKEERDGLRARLAVWRERSEEIAAGAYSTLNEIDDILREGANERDL
jgi:hypothetical protein